MKKLLIAIIIIIFLLLVSIFFFFKSDYYAELKRDKFIKKYSSVKLQYISEGVYLNKHPRFYNQTITDQFGEQRSEFVKIGETILEISFKSDKLILLNKQDNVIEEIFFSGKYEVEKIDENKTTYYLYISKWTLSENSTKKKIASFNTEKYIRLYLNKEEKPILASMCGFRSAFYFRNKTNLDCPQEVLMLELDKKIYSYSPGAFNVHPKYVEEASFPAYIYDLDRYR